MEWMFFLCIMTHFFSFSPGISGDPRSSLKVLPSASTPDLLTGKKNRIGRKSG